MSEYDIKAFVVFLGMELVCHCPDLLQIDPVRLDDPCSDAVPPCPQGVPPCPEGGQPCPESAPCTSDAPCGMETCVLNRSILLNRVLLRRKLQLGLEILGQPDTCDKIRVRLYGRKVCNALNVEPRGQYGLSSVRELPDFPGKLLDDWFFLKYYWLFINACICN